MKSTLFAAAVLLLAGYATPVSVFSGVAISRVEAAGAKCPPVVEKKYGRIRISAREIFRCLRAKNFRSFSTMHIKRGMYYVKARDAKGRRVSLVINPYNGKIVRLRYR